MVQRYIIEESLDTFATDPIRIDGEPFHHMTRVMRLRLGQSVILTDLAGISAYATIFEISKEWVELHFESFEDRNAELPIEVVIACGLPKGDKLEWIVQKSTELGVSAIIPFAAKHSVVKWDASKAIKKQSRLQKIAQEAAEQSHRRQFPEVKELMTLKQLLTLKDSFSHALIAYEEDAKQSEGSRFSLTLKQMKPGERLLLVFGPEGGLDPTEIEQLVAGGFQSCGLGPRILRTETAPLYALSAISYEFELHQGGK